jgi:hypothetical protein
MTPAYRDATYAFARVRDTIEISSATDEEKVAIRLELEQLRLSIEALTIEADLYKEL